MQHLWKWRQNWEHSQAMPKTQNTCCVIRNHRRAAQAATDGYEALAVKPVPLDHANCPDQSLIDLSVAADNALALGEKHGYRNAQVSGLRQLVQSGWSWTVTQQIEPDFAW